MDVHVKVSDRLFTLRNNFGALSLGLVIFALAWF